MPMLECFDLGVVIGLSSWIAGRLLVAKLQSLHYQPGIVAISWLTVAKYVLIGAELVIEEQIHDAQLNRCTKKAPQMWSS